MVIERIIDLVLTLMTEVKKENDFSQIDVKKFQNLGYSNSEISTAISWFIDENANFLRPIYDKSNTDNSFRVLSSVEQDLFTVDAWGEIIQLLSIGLLNYEIIEIMIERVIITGLNKIDSKFLRYFLAFYIFDVNQAGKLTNKYVLAGNETIN